MSPGKIQNRVTAPSPPAIFSAIKKIDGYNNAHPKGGTKTKRESIIFPFRVFLIFNPSDRKSTKLNATLKNEVAMAKKAKACAIGITQERPTLFLSASVAISP